MHHDHPSVALTLALASSPDNVSAGAELPQLIPEVGNVHRISGSSRPEGARGTFREVFEKGQESDIPDDVLLQVHIPNPATVVQEDRSSLIYSSSIPVSFFLVD